MNFVPDYRSFQDLMLLKIKWNYLSLIQEIRQPYNLQMIGRDNGKALFSTQYYQE